MMTDNRIKLFISYAHEDEVFRKDLEAHLSALHRQNFIDIWYDRNVNAGSVWEDEIDKHLNTAQIILLLVSSDFMNSERCSKVVMKRALERLEHERTHIVPILVRPYPWETTSLAQFNILPRSHVPIAESADPEETFCDIAKELRYLVEALSVNEWRDRGNELYRQGKYKDALFFYEKILRLKNSLAASIDIGSVLNDLQEYEEALHVYDTYSQAAQTDRSRTKNDSDGYLYKEALQVYALAFPQNAPHRFDSPWLEMAQDDIQDPISKSSLEQLNQAIQRSPMNPFLYHLKGNILFQLGQYREALGAYEQATQLQEGFDLTRQYLSKTLEIIGQQEYKKLNALAQHDLQKANQLRDKSDD